MKNFKGRRAYFGFQFKGIQLWQDWKQAGHITFPVRKQQADNKWDQAINLILSDTFTS